MQRETPTAAARYAIGAFALVAFSCHSLRVVERDPEGPPTRIRAFWGPRDAWIATMDPGTSGRSVLELPSRDLLLTGVGRHTFVQRLSSDGETRWTLQGCPPLDVVATTDDAFYLSTSSLLDTGGKPGEPVAHPASACPSRQPPARARGIVARLDGRGAVKWTLDTGLAGKVFGSTATHALFLGHEDVGASQRHELVAITAAGRVAYRRALPTYTIVGALSSPPCLLLAWTAPDDGGAGPRQCELSALEPTTGKTVWENVVPFGGSEVASSGNCDPEQILMSTRGAILIADRWANGAHRFAIGFDPVTGAVRFQRPLDLYRVPPGSRPDASLDPSMLLYIESQTYPSRLNMTGEGTNPVVVALNPKTGRETTVAIFRADFAENAELFDYQRLWVAGYAWGRSAVLATGQFRGRLVVEGLDADSGSNVETVCRNIDPGYGGGTLRDERGNCKFGTERLRAYAPALFVARIPVGE